MLIASGQLPPGEQLPTIRQLAGDLGVAKGTVSRVYEVLAREGLIEGNGRKGTAVAARLQRAEPAVPTELAYHAMRLALAAVQSGVGAEQVHVMLDEAFATLRAAR